jgi:hypothetical protein
LCEDGEARWRRGYGFKPVSPGLEFAAVQKFDFSGNLN